MTDSKKDGTPDVVLDLLAEDAQLRETLGKPMPIRIPGAGGEGEAVITVPPLAAWPHEASLLADRGVYGAWARQVLSEADFAAFTAAGLKSYQMQRIMAVVSAASGITPGKP